MIPKLEPKTVIKWIVTWCLCVFSPLSTAKQLLGTCDTNRKKWAQVVIIWIIPCSLAVLGQFLYLFGAYRDLGLNYEDKVLQVATSIFLCVALFAVGLMIHVVLRLFRIPSNIPDTLLIYGVTPGSLAPLTAVFLHSLSLPIFREAVNFLRLVKYYDLGILEAVRLSIIKIQVPQESWGWFDAGADVVAFVYILLYSKLSVMLADHYEIERFRVLSAVTFSVLCLVPLLLVITGLGYLRMLYSFV